MIEKGSSLIHPSSIKKGLTGLRAIADPLLTSKLYPAKPIAKAEFVSVLNENFDTEHKMQRVSKLGEEDSIMQESVEEVAPPGSRQDAIQRKVKEVMTDTGSLKVQRNKGTVE